MEIISCQIKFLWKEIRSFKGNNFLSNKIISCQRNNFLPNEIILRSIVLYQKYCVWIIAHEKGCLNCVQITLFRAKFGMCANHALSSKIFYWKSRMTRSENYYPTLLVRELGLGHVTLFFSFSYYWNSNKVNWPPRCIGRVLKVCVWWVVD